MSVVKLREKTINAKIVYYGPPLGGKTTSLKHIHHVMDPANQTNLISLNTDNDRTLFFDFLPINLGRIGDFSLKIQGYTVPGQVKFLLTRRFVLRGADAVVFVADSQRVEREHNRQSLADLKENLKLNGLDYDSIPLVLSYNKRDESDILSVKDLDEDLCDSAAPAFETVAVQGRGVFEAFTSVTARMVRRICDEYRLGDSDVAATAVREKLNHLMEGAAGVEPVVRTKEPLSTTTSTIIVSTDDDTGEFTAEDLLEQAVGTNVQVADLLSQVQETKSSLATRVAELSALFDLSRAAAADLDEDRVVGTVVEGAARALGTGHASILTVDDEDALRERGVHGFVFDPVVAADAGEAISNLDEPLVITASSHGDVLQSLREKEKGVRAAVVAPLLLRGANRGVLIVYFTGHGHEPGAETARFVGALADTASVALENARLHGEMARFNKDLEEQVEERTRELRYALRELQQLDQVKDDFLSNMSHELMTPLSGIRSSVEILRTYPDLSAEERKDFVIGIEEETGRLTGRLQDMLDLSALDAEKARFRNHPHAPAKLMSDALERARERAKASDVSWRVVESEGLPEVSCDPRWLDRALDHLVDNAIKFSPEGGNIDVEIRPDGDFVVMTIRDCGPGISDEQRPALFERFKQVGQVLTDKTPGIGAGLPLAKRVLEGHGGTLTVDNAEGGGAIVTLRLPVA
ncbi:MAG: ATP-binding protein [Planctomycetota bacterium]|jgi:signal transduction histidine kinase/signal recognition particle receptor subunit beta